MTQTALKSIPTTRWLLSSISNHLGNILGVTCKHKKYGTLLYRNGGDLLKALSRALGKLQQQKKSEHNIREDYKYVVQANSKPSTVCDDTIIQSCVALNQPKSQELDSYTPAGSFAALCNF